MSLSGLKECAQSELRIASHIIRAAMLLTDDMVPNTDQCDALAALFANVDRHVKSAMERLDEMKIKEAGR
ncbi:hypothetical protein AncyloWKF20_09500 [Ancylobacter sp. WKF20]|uniref:hypothetical protein n=1 Tax=Ancylobacter sp. WKF20 TaxID=3039801 RepID=UPI002434382B|nr:hypothetical protein [Ancylobacter sp. WKF20]WGD32027.1 hypothetical protein AncyloWKF20_09500 [Ancylobacter sp. WKF20]